MHCIAYRMPFEPSYRTLYPHLLLPMPRAKILGIPTIVSTTAKDVLWGPTFPELVAVLDTKKNLITGVSAITPYAIVAGVRAVNDRTPANVAQIVISGTMRRTRPGVVLMPAFGSTHSDTEIAAASNYVTARFGSARSGITDKV